MSGKKTSKFCNQYQFNELIWSNYTSVCWNTRSSPSSRPQHNNVITWQSALSSYTPRAYQITVEFIVSSTMNLYYPNWEDNRPPGREVSLRALEVIVLYLVIIDLYLHPPAQIHIQISLVYFIFFETLPLLVKIYLIEIETNHFVNLPSPLFCKSPPFLHHSITHCKGQIGLLSKTVPASLYDWIIQRLSRRNLMVSSTFHPFFRHHMAGNVDANDIWISREVYPEHKGKELSLQNLKASEI